MKFKHSWRDSAPVTIATAVDAKIDDNYDSGVAEHGLATARNAASAIGLLVQRPYEKGVLTKDDVQDFVSGSYEPVDDPEN